MPYLEKRVCADGVLTMGFSRRFVKYPFYNTSENAIEVGNISGADMMLRKSVLDTVGIFDPAPVRSDPDSADHFVLEA